MSSLRGRTRDSSWQWLLIGLVLAMGCCGIFAVGTYALGIWVPNIPGLALNPTAQPAIQTQIIIITTTPAPTIPVAATTDSANSTAGTAPTEFVQRPTDSQMVQPTASGGTTPVAIGNTPAGITPATQIPLPTQTSSGSVATIDTSASVSGADALAAIKTVLVEFKNGSSFLMGTDLTEATRAIEDCVDRDAGKCQASDAQDSIPSHEVLINAFSIEKYEVSTEQYVAFLNSLGPNSHRTGCDGSICAAIVDDQQFSHIKFDGVKYVVANPLFNDRPITFVTWYGADSYCRAIGRRLPTEAEWEFAARGGQSQNIYPWGNFWDPKADPNRALTSRSRTENQLGPSEVTAYPTGATATGIFNMAGNVSEWVADWYDGGYYGTLPPNTVDPKGPAASPSNHKVLRGGDWDALPFFARTVHRRDADPVDARATLGFRCASNESVQAGAGNPTPLPSGGVTQ
ncbi:MAG: SUMF1/EgtB/PvdO family nonheme iron enzyme [Anaerolineae bacterium]|nr:SUMF1/EgtB/PvdO family nonheme iron enzyme [Anaerolineae bacterium]